jgi:glycogen(starch) synthase
MFGAPGAFLAGIHQVVHTEHGRTFPGLRRHLVAERFASAFARYVVGVSEQLTDEMRRYIGIPARKLRTIVNGIEALAPVSGAEADPATLASMGVEPGAVVVGAVGRLVWQKGLVHLLRAWPQVRASSHRAVLLIVGEGELRDELGARSMHSAFVTRCASSAPVPTSCSCCR